MGKDSKESLKTEVAVEIVKDVYDDAGRPIVKPTGELLGLVPRAIKAALSGLEKWIITKEYNVEETRKLLEEKLKNIPPESIHTPEAYIGVPALQYLTYCMDNAELRDMYANLLAHSMTDVVKNGVHPAYVEFIKQLSPDEAKILKYIFVSGTIPTIDLRRENEKGEGLTVVSDFSTIGEKTNCENPYNISAYIENLVRLGLIKRASSLSTLINKTLYEPLKNHNRIKTIIDDIENKTDEYNKAIIKESYVSISSLGKSFCSICLNPITLHITIQGERPDQ